MRARELGMEQAALADGATDLARRIDTLVHGRARELSPYWQVDVETDSGTTVLRYSARVPNAAALDPVTIRPTFAFPLRDPEAAAAAKQLEHAFHYGSAATVPAQFVKHVAVEASDQARQLLGSKEMEIPGQITIGEAINNEGLPLVMTFKVMTPEGSAVASIDIIVSKRTVGGRGVQLIGSDASQLMNVTQIVDTPEPGEMQNGKFNFTFGETTGRFPYEARRVADFVIAMQLGNKIAVHVGPIRIGYADVGAEILTGAMPAARLIVILDELQQHFQDLFPIPSDLTLRNLLELEIAHRLLSGDRVKWLDRTITTGIRAERLKSFLQRANYVDAVDLVVGGHPMVVLCGEHEFALGLVELRANVRLANREELEAAAGTDAEVSAHWECTEGEHIYIMLPNDSTPAEQRDAGTYT
ncbi:hypothetical protein [Actinoplanes sp. HUAS TT8]|uniref:hypothetical protein n=1 Tax=Actinoplanes sp. HUAS TT8 TaxID=3447453 RepID=UPI003F526F29